MGSILSSRVQNDGRVVYEVVVEREEALQLRGNIDRIHIISEDAADIKSRISLRGKNDATKYFLIPKDFRDHIKKSREVECQKMDSHQKIQINRRLLCRFKKRREENIHYTHVDRIHLTL